MTFFYDLNKKLSDLAARQTLNEGKAKPDFLDIDKDGNKKETFKKAVADKEVAEGKDEGKPGKNFAKIAKSAGAKYGSKAAGERVAGAVRNKLAKAGKLEEDQVEEGAYQAAPDKSQIPAVQRKAQGPDWKMKMQDLEKEKTNSPTTSAGLARRKQELGMKESIKLVAVKEGADQTAKVYCDTAYNEFHVRVFSKGQEIVESRYFTESQDDAIATADYMVEGAFTMTPKQKSFAKLAPPTDKITFADKIAGAKKEVDEMLGDVAAEAMKKALGGGMGRSAEMDEEGHSPFTAHKRPHIERPKIGSIEHGALHDIEHTATGRKVTRRVDPNTGHSVGTDDDKPGEKRGRGRPGGKGAGKSIGAKGPSGKSKLMTREGDLEEAASFSGSELQKAWQLATSLKSFISDPQGREVWNDLVKLLKYKLSQGAQPVEEKAPPGEKAERMVKGIKKSLSKDGNLSGKDKAIAYATTWKAKKAGKVEEESTDKEDQHAEKAGKRVAKDIEHDEGHKGKDDNRAEKAGKKVTKDIEYDDKKDRKEKKKDEVEENTVSGSVAPAAGGKASNGSGGMTFGKGVYESTIAESFNSKLKTVLNEGMSVNMSADQDGKKSLTVTATDEDAVKLSQLLNLAGVGGQSEGYGAVCPGCGSSDCGCDHVEEDLANSGDNTEYADTDYMVNGLSGGLDGRKDTGQTVGAPFNRQPARQGPMAESNDVVELYKRIA